MNTKLLWISVLGLIGGAASSQLPIPQAVPFYEITDLGVLPGDDASFAVDLNSIGQIICISERSILVGEDWLTKYETFLWFGGRATDIGTPPGHTDIVPVAINQRGRILVNSVDDVYSTFIWKDGSFIDLGSLPGSIASYGGGISNFDEVAGYSILSDDTAVPWIWDNGSLQQLVGGVGEAFDIDDYPTVFADGKTANGSRSI
jgi:uncharacterized membrane protein